MPRIEQDFAFTVKNLRAFLKFDVGVGRRSPGNSPDSPRREGRKARSAPRGNDAEKRLAGELRRETERRERAENNLARLRDGKTPKGSHALPEPDDTVDRGRIFQSMLSQFKKGRMLDLGAGPGQYSLAAAALGWDVTAVDARTMRTPDAEAEKHPARAELIRSVNWVEADIREFPIERGEYDLICIFGLLHHLEVEDHVKLLSRCSDTLTLLNARVAPRVAATEGTYEGMYFKEPGETREERDKMPANSWGNESSFIHTEESLVRLAQDCGFAGAMAMRPPHTLNYTFYMCLPPPE